MPTHDFCACEKFIYGSDEQVLGGVHKHLKGKLDANAFSLRSGLRNPREHESAAPRKKIWMAEKTGRKLEKKYPQKKKRRGLRMLNCSLIWR